MGAPHDTQKTIFITGAGSGIGRAVAQLFSARGWFTALADVSSTGLDETAASIGDGALSKHVFDVRDREAWARAMQEFGALSGHRLDVLFNNAGVGRGGNFEDVAPEDFDLVIDVNIKGVANGIVAALPLLKAAAPSTILNTASVAGFVTPPRLGAYVASKFAVRGLTESLNIEFAKYNVRVATLAPWFVDTAILDNRSGQSNHTLRDALKAGRVPIYPVSFAAEAAWEAVHGARIHTMVGKAAKRAAFAARFFPNALRKQLSRDGL